MPPTNNTDRFDQLAETFEDGFSTIKDLFTKREAEFNEVVASIKDLNKQLTRIEKFMEGDGRHPPVSERFILIENKIEDLLKFKAEVVEQKKQFSLKQWQVWLIFISFGVNAFLFFLGLWLRK